MSNSAFYPSTREGKHMAQVMNLERTWRLSFFSRSGQLAKIIILTAGSEDQAAHKASEMLSDRYDRVDLVRTVESQKITRDESRALG